MNETISILGCGWLGLPLGKYLVEKGFSVKGSTTKEEKLEIIKTYGIEPFLIKLNPALEGENIANFLNTNVLIINIPPKVSLQKTDAHVEQVFNLLTEIKKSSIEKIIYISSTSVYPELNREVFEEDISTPEASASPTLVKAENLLLESLTSAGRHSATLSHQNDNSNPLTERSGVPPSRNQQLTILRCGGLMGYDRIPAKYFAGWKGLTTGETPVNYIHRDDLIGIIETIINKDLWNEIFNIVSPIHPIRKEIYAKNCQVLGYEMPEFVTPKTPEPFKIISPKKWIEKSEYQYLYENPLDFFYEKKS